MTRCTATTAAGTPCKNLPMNGSDRCVAHLGRNGRKTNLTPELQDQLAAMLSAGNYLAVCCRAVGLPQSTYKMWFERGASDAPKDALYARFRDRMEEARARGEVRLVAEVSNAARENWQAAVWLLERLHPDRWARVSQRPEKTPESSPEPGPPVDPLAELDELAPRRNARA